MNQLFENKKSTLEKSNQSSKKSLNSASNTFDGLYQLQELANQKSESIIQHKADSSSNVQKLSSFSEMASNKLDSNFQNLNSVAQLNPGDTATEETPTAEAATAEAPTAEAAPNQQQLMQRETWVPEEGSEERKKLEEEFSRTTFYYGTVGGKLITPKARGIQKFGRLFSNKLTKNRVQKYDKLNKYEELKKLKDEKPFETWSPDEKKEYLKLEQHKDETESRWGTDDYRNSKQYDDLKKHKDLYDQKTKEVEEGLKDQKTKKDDKRTKLINDLLVKQESIKDDADASKANEKRIRNLLNKNEENSYWDNIDALTKDALINKKVREERGFFEAGNRQAGYLEAKMGAEGDKRADYMDNYYGNKGTGLASQRSNIIGEFVHKSMGYNGEYEGLSIDAEGNKIGKTGRDTWIETYGEAEAYDRKGNVRFKSSLPQLNSSNQVDETIKGEPFKFNSLGDNKEQEGLYGSMEISRHIREGVKKFGGRIVFEVGGSVFFESAFVRGKPMGDTNVEIAFLLPYFAGKNSAVVPFGKGEIVLQKGGKEIIPTKSLFLSSWSLKSVKENLTVEQTQDGKIHTYDKDGVSIQEDQPNSLFEQFGSTQVTSLIKKFEDLNPGTLV